MHTLLKHIIVEPATSAEATVIWFHGLGADGHDFEPIVPQLALPETLPIRFIFPHAPVIPITINGGYPMPAWFDITSLAPHHLTLDERGLMAAIQAAYDLIQAEINKGISPERIVLAGFSQGGVVALSAALTYSKPLAGVMALSTFMPTTQLAAINNNRLPIYMAHGKLDDVIPIFIGEQTHQALIERNFEVTWQAYNMGHEVCKDEIHAISEWLQLHLAKTAVSPTN